MHGNVFALVMLAGLAACPRPRSASEPMPEPEPEPEREVVVQQRDPTRVPIPVQRRELVAELSPVSLVSTGQSLVWTDVAGAIWTAAVAGGAPVRLSDQKTHDFAGALQLAGEVVLATSRRGLMRIELPAGPVTAVAITGLPDQPEVSVADAAHVYVTVFQRDEVMRLPIAGGKAQKLANVARGVLGLHGDTLYIASYSTGVLYAVPTAGGALRVITRGLPRPTAVAADASHAYVYCEGDGTIRRVDLATGAMDRLAGELVNSDEVVLDGDWVYTRSWSGGGNGAGSLVRIPKAGGPLQTLADDLHSPYRITTDAEAIYVTSRDDKRIIRFPRSGLPVR